MFSPGLEAQAGQPPRGVVPVPGPGSGRAVATQCAQHGQTFRCSRAWLPGGEGWTAALGSRCRKQPRLQSWGGPFFQGYRKHMPS